MNKKTKSRDRDIVVAALKHAAPYIRMFKGKTFIVKAGGEAFLDAAVTRALMEQIAILHQVGIQVIVVHGAGPQTTRRTQDNGLKVNMIDGRRVTDAATIQMLTEANNEIGELIQKVCEGIQLPAVIMGGTKPGPVVAAKRPPAEVPGHGLVDYGFVGDVQSIDTALIEAELNQGRVPIVSALSAAPDGSLLNINADTVAGCACGQTACGKDDIGNGRRRYS